MPKISPAPSATLRGLDLQPLAEFYKPRHIELPTVERVDAEELPEPYRSLLVHHTDMTSTLEKFHGQKIHIRLIERRGGGSDYFRQVVLLLDQSFKPVEFGAIKINLDLFPVEAQKEILRERRPLGQIMHDAGMSFSSRPGAFFRVASDGLIGQNLGLDQLAFLYGRRNTLFNSQNLPLAEIVEILPP